MNKDPIHIKLVNDSRVLEPWEDIKKLVQLAFPQPIQPTNDAMSYFKSRMLEDSDS